MNLLAPLLAALDAGDVIRIVVIVLIFVIPVIGQLIGKLAKVQPPAGRPIPPPPADIDVADEIEAFMRRAAQRNAGQGARPAATEQTPPLAEPVQAEVVADKPVGGQAPVCATRHLDVQDFNQSGSQLGKEVLWADRQIDQHLHQVFDHRVSNLEAAPTDGAQPSSVFEPAAPPGTAESMPDFFTTGLLELLASPDSLRQAIILNEILHRPEERWA
jgi:hypothetical protein